jgi:hypothetical protein
MEMENMSEKGNGNGTENGNGKGNQNGNGNRNGNWIPLYVPNPRHTM